MHARTFCLVVIAGVIVGPTPFARAADTPAQVFEERILPIFKSPNPSSCVRCHLASVDLKDYILPSAKETFVALREQGLIDLARPESSKILTLIQRGADDPGASELITAKQQRAEYEAFAAWIKSCAGDPAYRDAPRASLGAPRGAPMLATKPAEVVRHARKDRVLESFEKNVWSLRFRCMNCHTEGTPQNDKLVKEHGARVAWFKKGGPAATMEYLLGSRLIDLSSPEKSLLLTKPLGEVKHGGGIKIVKGDQGYKAIRGWIEDVAAIKAGQFATAASLPPRDSTPLQFGTEAWLKLDKTPEAWGGKLLMVEVFAWDQAAKAWETSPVATSDRMVGATSKLWQHTVNVLASPDSDRAKRWKHGKPVLPAGKYLVRVYVDRDGKVARDWQAKLGPDEYVGQAEFQAQWREGYGAMTVVDATRVTK